MGKFSLPLSFDLLTAAQGFDQRRDLIGGDRPDVRAH